MPVVKTEELPIRDTPDLVAVRQKVRAYSAELRFSLVDQTKMVTAASELARNALVYGGGGVMQVEVLDEGAKKGLRLVFVDQGPGIPDIPQALQDGFSTGGGLGLGLGGARRLVNEFDLASKPGEGTRITVVRWK